jgi:gliding motility-associated-like protein
LSRCNNISSTQIKLDSLIAGSYHIVITDAHHCSIDTIVHVTQPSSYFISIQSVTPPLCNGFNDGKILIGVNPPNNYSIYLDGNLNSTGDTFINVNAGSHVIRAATNATCHADTTIIVPQPAKFISWVNDSLNIPCTGMNSGMFSLTSRGGTMPYQYSIPKLYGGFTHDTIFSHLPPNHYLIFAEDNHGCLDTLNIKITQPDSVLSETKYTDDASCYFKLDGTIKLNILGGTRPYTTSITPIEGNYQSSTQIENGYYLIKIVDNNGCTINDSALIDVKCCLAILPNAFSPNNDGINDKFGILNPDDFLSVSKFEIYDRWGALLFSTTDKTKSWDGTYNGVVQPIGVYMYFVSINCSRGRTSQLKGNLTLIR